MLTVALLSCASAAAAQDAAQDEVPRGFIGGGVVRASRDASSRMRLFDADPMGVWVVEGGVRVASRLSLGAEFVQPGAARAVTRGITFESHGEQHERAVLGTARVRLAASDVAALDAVMGAGIMFQRHELRNSACVRCDATRTETMINRAPAYAVGVDVPIRVTDHLSIGVLSRVYFLNRGDHTGSGPPDEPPWQFTWRSSRRFGVGATARATW